MSFERQVRGNPCTVSLAVAPPDAPPEDPIHIPCASWRIADDRAGVRCWALNGQAITLCGHGLLCTGAAWMRSHAAVSELEMNGLARRVLCRGRPGLDRAAADRLQRGTGARLGAATFFPTPPWRAAQWPATTTAT
jgi:hypothetical protein